MNINEAGDYAVTVSHDQLQTSLEWHLLPHLQTAANPHFSTILRSWQSQSDLPYALGKVRPALRPWQSRACPTLLATSDLPYAVGKVRPTLRSWQRQTYPTLLVQLGLP